MVTRGVGVTRRRKTRCRLRQARRVTRERHGERGRVERVVGRNVKGGHRLLARFVLRMTGRTRVGVNVSRDEEEEEDEEARHVAGVEEGAEKGR